MKSIITLNLEGTLLQYLPRMNEKDYLPPVTLVVVINGKMFPIDLPKSTHIFTDPWPDKYICQIELQLHDTNKKGWLNKTGSRMIDSISYQFERKINGKMSHTLNQKMDPFLTKITISYHNSDLIIPKIDPIMGESPLEMVEVPIPIGPCDLSTYFHDYNHDQLTQGLVDHASNVCFLRIKHMISNRYGITCNVYYQSYEVSTKNYESSTKAPATTTPTTTPTTTHAPSFDIPPPNLLDF